MKSKTIILSNENQKGRGILTIYQEDDLLQCRIRLYNIEKLDRYCKIGIYHEKKVFSANLLEKSGVYTSSVVGNFNIDKDFYTAIINTNNNNEVILSGGTYSGFFFNDNSVFESTNLNSVFENKIEKENPNTNLFNHKETNNATKLEINSNETSCDDCNQPNCEKCVYKEYFYSHANLDETNQLNNEFNKITNNILNKEEIKTQVNNEIENNEKIETKTILESLIPQFKYVFENYPKDETLCQLIPNSKFVKINENNEQYSIGAIYVEDEMKYICYAVLCNYNTPAPKELGEHYQWLPLDNLDPLSEGYYIVFQDANDLKIVEL